MHTYVYCMYNIYIAQSDKIGTPLTIGKLVSKSTNYKSDYESLWVKYQHYPR